MSFWLLNQPAWAREVRPQRAKARASFFIVVLRSVLAMKKCAAQYRDWQLRRSVGFVEKAGAKVAGASVTGDGRSAALENSVCGDYLHCLRTLATVEGFARLTYPTKGARAHDLEADLHQAEAFPYASQ